MTLMIEKGEFVFLTGPSGAGKTTFLRVLFAQERIDEGQLLIDGQDVTRLPPSRIPALRRQMGLVFQDFKLLPRKTVFENIAYSLRLAGVARREIAQRIQDLLRLVRLDGRAEAYPTELSAGEQQRVSIARAVVGHPAILLADEPTGNLDHELSLEIFDLFRTINARGTTVIVATHNRELIRLIPKRTITLDQGSLVHA